MADNKTQDAIALLKSIDVFVDPAPTRSIGRYLQIARKDRLSISGLEAQPVKRSLEDRLEIARFASNARDSNDQVEDLFLLS